jgi:phosphoglycolate phosphatase
LGRAAPSFTDFLVASGAKVIDGPLSQVLGGQVLGQNPARPTIVLFDLDGTLVHHTNPRVLQMLEFLDDLSHGSGRLAARFRLMRRSQLATRQNSSSLVVHRTMHRLRRKSVEAMLQPCEAMRSVLDLLRANGIPMGMVSNGLGKGYGQDVLDAFDLRQYFSTCIFREDVRQGKPSAEPILAALGSIGRPITRSDVVWYVGDQRKDITSALVAAGQSGHAILPIGLGARAAIASADNRVSIRQVMWSAADLIKLVESTFLVDEPIGPSLPFAYPATS